MISRIVICVVIAFIVFGLLHLFETRVKREPRTADPKRSLGKGDGSTRLP